MISEFALKVGKYLNDHWFQFFIIRLVIIAISIINFALDLWSTLVYLSKHNDYHIY